VLLQLTYLLLDLVASPTEWIIGVCQPEDYNCYLTRVVKFNLINIHLKDVYNVLFKIIKCMRCKVEN